jgi:hypothetical protein
MMRVLFRLNKNKRAISNMVGYVLLIAITIGLSIFVYNWLSFYVGGEGAEECPEGVSIVIRDYECYSTNEFGAGRIKVSLKNRGRFSTDGYTLRVHDQEGADFGFYVLDENGVVLAPGEEYERTYNFSEHSFDGYNISTVTWVEVQPFVVGDEKVSCKTYTSQEVFCYSG